MSQEFAESATKETITKFHWSMLSNVIQGEKLRL